eukprot:11196458-Lingulodinium_polyedra.AAC.1
MDRRPIWLLPMLYRVWSAGRARDMAGWVAAWGGGSPDRSAAELAGERAVELESAEAAGEAIAG